MNDHRRIALVIALLAGAVAVGYAVASRPTMAIALCAFIVFCLTWAYARPLVLVVPLAWVALGDPALLTTLGIASWGGLYYAVDAWSALSFLAASATLLLSDSGRRLLRRPASIGILAFWAAFIIATLVGGNHLGARAAWLPPVRALLGVGWYFVVLAVAEKDGVRFVGRGLVAGTGALAVKGLLFWLLGVGVMSASSSAGYRAFGSEEATVGIIALLIGIAMIAIRPRPRMLAEFLVFAGVFLVLLSSLRAFWVVGIVSVLVMVGVDALRGSTGQTRRMVILIGAAGALVVSLLTFGRRFFTSSIASRLSTLVGGESVGSDQSLSYRLLEFGTVKAAVGSRVLFGGGLTATHRGSLYWPTDDPVIQATLPAYVHNTFLWAFLKAGITGVAGAIGLYLGLVISALETARIRVPLVAAIGRGLLYTVPALVVVGLFNAHVSSLRYMMTLGMVFGFAVSLNALHGKDVADVEGGEPA